MNPLILTISGDNTRTKHNSSFGFGLGTITECHPGREPSEPQRSTEYYSVSLIDTAPYRSVRTVPDRYIIRTFVGRGRQLDSETTCC